VQTEEGNRLDRATASRNAHARQRGYREETEHQSDHRDIVMGRRRLLRVA
jgi:hypothetical protein